MNMQFVVCVTKREIENTLLCVILLPLQPEEAGIITGKSDIFETKANIPWNIRFCLYFIL